MVLSKALEELECAQAACEPDVLTNIHELLDRGLISTTKATSLLRASMLVLIHRLRLDRPDRPIIIIKPCSLAAVWRTCELLPAALPGCVQILQWRAADKVVGSFDAAVLAGTPSTLTRALHKRQLDGRLWGANGIPSCMQRFALVMDHELGPLPPDPCPVEAPRLAPTTQSQGDDQVVQLDVPSFAKLGSLGFLCLHTCFHFHVATHLRHLWHCTLSYETLVRHKSAAVKQLLGDLGWLHHLIPQATAALGTEVADAVFGRDVHANGGLAKCGGSRMVHGTETTSGSADAADAVERRDDDSLNDPAGVLAAHAASQARKRWLSFGGTAPSVDPPPSSFAVAVAELMLRHGPLAARHFDLSLGKTLRVGCS